MQSNFLPLSDAELLAWSQNFSTRLTADYAQLGITQQAATQYAALQAWFATSLTAATNPATRGGGTILTKDTVKKNLIASTRQIVRQIQAHPGVTDQQRYDLGINIRKARTPNPVPATCPIVRVRNVNGRVITVELRAEQAGKRGKPSMVKGAFIFTYTGDVAPEDPSKWTNRGAMTRTMFEISFEESTVANTVWITAAWFNDKGQAGIACAPVNANLPASPVLPMSQSMKIAA